MQRDSTKHGARLDDELKHETRPLEQGAPVEPRVEEAREKEGPGDEDRDVDARTAPGALGADDVEARRELSRHLRLSAFPAVRDELIAEARENDAPQPVLDALAGLPERTQYRTVHEVWAAVGGAAGSDDLGEVARTDPLSGGER
jgi:Protein of unknown function (DUF2795)